MPLADAVAESIHHSGDNPEASLVDEQHQDAPPPNDSRDKQPRENTSVLDDADCTQGMQPRKENSMILNALDADQEKGVGC